MWLMDGLLLLSKANHGEGDMGQVYRCDQQPDWVTWDLPEVLLIKVPTTYKKLNKNFWLVNNGQVKF